MNEWVQWHGGTDPSFPYMVDVLFRSGVCTSRCRAERLRWDHLDSGGDIVAYRKHTPELKEPTMLNNSNISTVLATARAEVQAEAQKKAVDALKVKLRALASAKAIVANLEREVKDLEASIEDGSFAV